MILFIAMMFFFPLSLFLSQESIHTPKIKINYCKEKGITNLDLGQLTTVWSGEISEATWISLKIVTAVLDDLARFSPLSIKRKAFLSTT